MSHHMGTFETKDFLVGGNMKAAILIDGGYYRKVALKTLRKNNSPEDDAKTLIKYCMRHLKERRGENETFYDLYRIFYYDCPPLDTSVFHPLSNTVINMKKEYQYTWMNTFLKELKKTRKVALRLGRLSENETRYTLKYESVKKLLNKTLTLEELSKQDFQITSTQKGVDMKIGVDIASLAYKKQVDKIVLLAGDSDFVPAAKLARREGIDFVLDSLGRKIKDDLFEHIDGLRCCDDKLKIQNNR